MTNGKTTREQTTQGNETAAVATGASNTNRSVLVRLQLYNKLGTLEGSRNKQLWEGGGQRHSTYGHKHSALTVDCYCC